MSFHIQNRQSVQSTQLDALNKTDDKKSVGSFKDFMVNLGIGLGKLLKFLKNVFKSEKKPLANRKAEVGETRTEPRVKQEKTKDKAPVKNTTVGQTTTAKKSINLSNERRLELANATSDELEQGFLNVDKERVELKGEEFKPDPQKFRMAWCEAICDQQGRLRAELRGNARNQFSELLLKAVGNNPSPGTILRSNSTATYLQNFYFRAVGDQYITDMIKPTVEQMMLFTSDQDVEMRPEHLKCEPNEVQAKIQENAQRLEQMYTSLLDRICDSSQNVPQEFCNWCKDIHDTIIRQGGSPEAARSGTAAAIILRVLNPVLVAPHTAPQENGICEQPVPVHVQRGLLNLSKVLQNQANCIHNFDKDQNLKPLEGLLAPNSNKFANFLDAVIQRGV